VGFVLCSVLQCFAILFTKIGFKLKFTQQQTFSRSKESILLQLLKEFYHRLEGLKKF
jgi:hypothetical protein